MKNKINIAEILKDCPSGMELDCTMYNEVTLLTVDRKNKLFPIKLLRKDGYFITLTKYGQYAHADFAKCVIFPKGKTTWEGFVPPCKFKTGDVLYIDCADKESDGDVYKYIFILKEIDSLGNCFSYCHLCIDGFFTNSYLADNRYTPRFATEEEKQKLFNAIKENGYKWNDETKTLEKLIIPKFKVGDKVKHKNLDIIYTIKEVATTLYHTDKQSIFFEHQDNWEVIEKFDINNFKPFDKVLVRDNNTCRWRCSYFSHINRSPFIFTCIGGNWRQCIPYENNEHLRGTTDSCNDYYKIW